MKSREMRSLTNIGALVRFARTRRDHFRSRERYQSGRCNAPALIRFFAGGSVGRLESDGQQHLAATVGHKSYGGGERAEELKRCARSKLSET